MRRHGLHQYTASRVRCRAVTQRSRRCTCAASCSSRSRSAGGDNVLARCGGTRMRGANRPTTIGPATASDRATQLPRGSAGPKRASSAGEGRAARCSRRACQMPCARRSSPHSVPSSQIIANACSAVGTKASSVAMGDAGAAGTSDTGSRVDCAAVGRATPASATVTTSRGSSTSSGDTAASAKAPHSSHERASALSRARCPTSSTSASTALHATGAARQRSTGCGWCVRSC